MKRVKSCQCCHLDKPLLSLTRSHNCSFQHILLYRLDKSDASQKWQKPRDTLNCQRSCYKSGLVCLAWKEAAGTLYFLEQSLPLALELQTWSCGYCWGRNIHGNNEHLWQSSFLGIRKQAWIRMQSLDFSTKKKIIQVLTIDIFIWNILTSAF